MSMTSTFPDHSKNLLHFFRLLFSLTVHRSFVRSNRSKSRKIHTHTHKRCNMWPKSCWYSHFSHPFDTLAIGSYLVIKLPDTEHFHFSIIFTHAFLAGFFFCSTHSFGRTVFVSFSFSLSFVQTTFLVRVLIIHNRASIHFAYIVRVFFFCYLTRIQYVVHVFHRSHAQANFHTQSYIIFGSCVVYAFFSILLRYIHLILPTRALRNAYHVLRTTYQVGLKWWRKKWNIETSFLHVSQKLNFFV